MTESSSVKVLPFAAVGAVLFLVYLSLRRPYLFDSGHLIALVAIVVAGFIGSQYRTHFWTLTIVVFLWAGSDVPFAGPMQIFRWIMLALAALMGLVLYGRSSDRIHFNYLHLLALFVVVAAFTSAIVSVNPLLTSLKAVSLLALFIYGSVGMRILWGRQPELFLSALGPSLDILTCFTAACYAVSFEVWGNLNSLGVITGVVCWPFLLWRFVLAEGRAEYLRRGLVLAACALLLFVSQSRASMLAALLSATVFLVAARRYRTLLVGISLTAAALTMLFLLSPERFQNASDALLYKQGKRGQILQSRQEPWEKSMASFREHPWLGLGFGVAETSGDWRGGFHTPAFQSRERGSSYFTMLEGTGLVGMVPFALLVLGLVRESTRVFRWLRLTGSVSHPAVPAACLVVAGLIHAIFEDWLLAVGYYMTVIFWLIVLSLRDWMACPAPIALERAPTAQPVPVSTGSLVLR